MEREDGRHALRQTIWYIKKNLGERAAIATRDAVRTSSSNDHCWRDERRLYRKLRCQPADPDNRNPGERTPLWWMDRMLVDVRGDVYHHHEYIQSHRVHMIRQSN